MAASRIRAVLVLYNFLGTLNSPGVEKMVSFFSKYYSRDEWGINGEGGGRSASSCAPALFVGSFGGLRSASLQFCRLGASQNLRACPDVQEFTAFLEAQSRR